MTQSGMNRSGLACLGGVVSVDSIGRTCRVKTIGSMNSGAFGLDDLDIPFVRILHGNWHPKGDEQVNIPRPGAVGVVMFVGSEAIWLGGIKLDMSNGLLQQNNQEQLDPGDWTVGTVGGAQLKLTAGGSVTLESTDFCHTYWLPDQNLINSICENFELETSGGTLYWKVNKKTSDTTLSLTVWDNATPNSIMSVNVGTVPDNPEVMLELNIGPASADENTPSQDNFSLQIGYDGTLGIDIGPQNATLIIDANGRTTFNTRGDIVIKSTGAVSYKASGGVEFTMSGGLFAVGAGEIELLKKIADALQKIATWAGDVGATHTHIGNLGAPTLAPNNAAEFVKLQADLTQLMVDIQSITGTLSSPPSTADSTVNIPAALLP